MPEPRGGLGLALRPGSGLPLARDDLQGDVEPVLLVPREPHRPGPAGPQRPERPVPPEDELALERGGSSVLHGFEMGWRPAMRVLFRPPYGVE